MERKNVFAMRLRNARIICGCSMDDLVVRMGGRISKMSVSKYEAGEMLPSSDVLISFANALGRKPDYFFRPFSVELEKICFRKKSALPRKMENSIKHQVADFAERYIEIEEICCSEESSELPSFPVRDSESINQAAALLSAQWKIGEDGIQSVVDMLEEHGVKVYELETSLEFDGLSASLGRYGDVIVVNQGFSPERKRFTLLHELGHLVLRFDETVETKKQEQLCHVFASAMLISEARLIAYLGRSRRDISYQELKAIQIQYGISVDALMHKAKDAGIISVERYRSFCIQKNRNKEFKDLIESSYYKDERSNRFTRLVFKALSTELITESKAAELLNADVAAVHREIELL